MNVKTVEQFQVAMTAAAKAVAEELGLSVTRCTTSYGTTNATLKIAYAVSNENGLPSTDKYWLKRHGFEDDIVGQPMVVGGRAATLISVNTKNRKYPVIYQYMGSKGRYKGTVDFFKRANQLAKERPHLYTNVVSKLI